MIRRREFISVLGGAAVWPLAAHAQQRQALPLIALIDAGSAETAAAILPTFRQGLGDTGFVEGRNVAIEYRFANNNLDRLPDLAADLARRKVAVFAAVNTPAAFAARAADPTIPMVFHTGGDPVATGLIASFNRPGGNITAVNSMNNGLLAKQLDLLHKAVPRAVRFAVLIQSNVNRNFPERVRELQSAASALGLQLDILTVSSSSEIDSAFETLMQKRVEALIVASGPPFRDIHVQLVTLASRYRIPAIYAYSLVAAAGGLMSYGAAIGGRATVTDVIRVMGSYVGRILKGENAGDLPAQRSTNFEFVINLQTARALGIEVPPTLLAITDQVIE
jgi:putative ABC transport system substrate-binding protein